MGENAPFGIYVLVINGRHPDHHRHLSAGLQRDVLQIFFSLLVQNELLLLGLLIRYLYFIVIVIDVVVVVVVKGSNGW